MIPFFLEDEEEAVKGQPIPANDMWIAAQALENGCVICTHDKHFSAIDGLVIGNTVDDLML